MASMEPPWTLGTPPLVVLAEDRAPTPPASAARPDGDPDPATLLLTCANCGAMMDEHKCKLVCTCGYFQSCSDYC